MASRSRRYEDFVELLPEKKPGDVVKVKVMRAGEIEEVELTLGERPAAPARRGGDPRKPFLDALGGQRENVQGKQGDEGFEYGGLYRSEDGGESWTRINSLNPRPMYFSQVRVDPKDEKKLYVLGVSLYRSSDGGKTFKGDGGSGVHADQHAFWIDPEDGRHMLLGCDGGLYITYDRMDHWDHLNHLALGQFYDVALDTRRVYHVYGGLQDNGTWGGPSRTLSQTGPINQDWFQVGGGDGFGAQVDRDDPDQVYFTSQNGAVGRRHLRTGETAFFRPRSEDREEAVPVQLEHAVSAFASELPDLLHGGEPGVPVSGSGERPEADLAGHHAYGARFGDGAGGVAERSERAVCGNGRRGVVGVEGWWRGVERHHEQGGAGWASVCGVDRAVSV